MGFVYASSVENCSSFFEFVDGVCWTRVGFVFDEVGDPLQVSTSVSFGAETQMGAIQFLLASF